MSRSSKKRREELRQMREVLAAYKKSLRRTPRLYPPIVSRSRGGRPRIHESNAARQKAWRSRLKAAS